MTGPGLKFRGLWIVGLGFWVVGSGLHTGCGPKTETPAELSIGAGDMTKTDGKFDASAVAVFLDFAFDAQLSSDSSWNLEGQIEDQLLYTIGQLNGEKSVGRLDQLQLSNVKHEADGSGGTLISYHAVLPVAWGQRDKVPSSYSLMLPRKGSSAAQDAFTERYQHSCVEWGAHDVDAGSMWYYFRPNRSGCKLDPADAQEAKATVSVSTVGTTGKYPEYDLVWQDQRLEVVAIFGKYEDGATGASDAGISAYNRFVQELQDALAPYSPVTTTPATLPAAPGVEVPDITFEATLPDGKQISVVTLLVDNVRTAGSRFSRRYESLTPTADFITYNGHAGLGSNIRSLASRGAWSAGQYAIVFMNGCDSYAYVDSALFDAHASVNSDDPEGTKYLDIVTNAMPSFFSNMAHSTLAIMNGLLAFDEPQSYERIFGQISSTQVVLVSGEQDNVYVPGGGGGSGETGWAGLSQAGVLKRAEDVRYETPSLAPGRYRFELTGDGDADLYVRVGLAPTTGSFDCRPYKTGSNERCEAELSSASAIHVMVRGYAASSTFKLLGEAL